MNILCATESPKPRRITHSFVRVCTHLYEPFQLTFARHAQQLFHQHKDLELIASHQGLTIRAETEEAIDAAVKVLSDFYGPQIRVSPPLKPGAHRISKAETAQPRVLCAVDLSPRSQRAVRRAVMLANELDAKLVLLHVESPELGIDDTVSAREQIARQLASIRPRVKRAPTIRVHAGEYIQTIATVARDIDADLIVLGPQRRRPLASLLGTTAERLIRLAGRPVLIVNRDPRMRYSAVLVAAEFSDAFSRVIRTASSLRFLEANSVSVVQGFESPYRGPLYAEGFDLQTAKRNIDEWERAAQRKLLQKLNDAGVDSARFRVVLQQSSPIRAIQRMVRNVRPDLLIVGTNERSILGRVMRGSVANDALLSIECDILVASPGVKSPGVLLH